MKALIIILLMAAASPLDACNAFKKSEYVSGMNKICIYDHLGSDYAITIGHYQICPYTVMAKH